MPNIDAVPIWAPPYDLRRGATLEPGRCGGAVPIPLGHTPERRGLLPGMMGVDSGHKPGDASTTPASS